MIQAGRAMGFDRMRSAWFLGVTCGMFAACAADRDEGQPQSDAERPLPVLAELEGFFDGATLVLTVRAAESDGRQPLRQELVLPTLDAGVLDAGTTETAADCDGGAGKLNIEGGVAAVRLNPPGAEPPVSTGSWDAARCGAEPLSQTNGQAASCTRLLLRNLYSTKVLAHAFLEVTTLTPVSPSSTVSIPLPDTFPDDPYPTVNKDVSPLDGFYGISNLDSFRWGSEGVATPVGTGADVYMLVTGTTTGGTFPYTFAARLRGDLMDMPARSDVVDGTSDVSCSGGTPGNGSASGPVALSSDGRYVAFTSNATNLVVGTGSAIDRVYRADFLDAEHVSVELVSQSAAVPDPETCHSRNPSISHDGMVIAFESDCALDPADTNDKWDVYVRRLDTAATIFASRTYQGLAPSYGASAGAANARLTPNGDWVVFEAAATDSPKMVATFPAGRTYRDIYRRRIGVASDSAIIAVTRISNNPEYWVAGDSFRPSVGGGAVSVTRTVFETAASGVTTESDTNGKVDVFAFAHGITDSVVLPTSRIRVSETPTDEPLTDDSAGGFVSADSSYVGFHTRSEVFPGIVNGFDQVYVRDKSAAPTLWLVSRRAGSDSNDVGEPGNGHSTHGAFAHSNGRFVAFRSEATDLGVAVPAGAQVLLFDRYAKQLAFYRPLLASADRRFSPVLQTVAPFAPAFSYDARYVGFTSDGSVVQGSSGMHAFRVPAGDQRITAAAAGVWRGQITVTDNVPPDPDDVRELMLLLHPRADGRLLGYALGGTFSSTIHTAATTGHLGDTLQMTLMLGSPEQPFEFTGSIVNDTLTGFASGQPATFSRVTTPVYERRFFAAGSEFQQPAPPATIAVALSDMDSGLLAGAWVDEAGSWSLGGTTGAITGFSAIGNAYTLQFGASSACPVGYSAALDECPPGSNQPPGCAWLVPLFGPLPAGTYAGERQCGASQAGYLALVETAGTTAGDAATVLASLAGFADWLEGGASPMLPHPSLSDSYLHGGENATAFLNRMQTEFGGRSATSTMDRVREIGTDLSRSVFVPSMCDTAAECNGFVDFHERREVAYECTSTSHTAVRDAYSSNAPFSDLGFVRSEARQQRVVGNQAPLTTVQPIDLPFAYVIAGNRIQLPTIGGQLAYLSLGTYGAHDGPQTGHREGNAKADLVAFPISAPGELVTTFDWVNLQGDPCDVADDTCGVSEEYLAARRVRYVMPQSGRVTSVVCAESGGPNGKEAFGAPASWRVRVEFDGGLTAGFGHVARIPYETQEDSLWSRLVACGGSDLDPSRGTLPYFRPSECQDTEYLPANCEIRFAIGFVLAEPHMPSKVIGSVNSQPLYGGTGAFPDLPWSQIEFSVHVPGTEGDRCIYDYLDPDLTDLLQDIISEEMMNPESLRYGSGFHALVQPSPPRWRWAGEARLCNVHGPNRDHAPPLLESAELRPWYAAEEFLALAPIDKTPPVGDEALWKPQTEFLVHRGRWGGTGPHVWNVEGTNVDPFYPAGELVAHGACGFIVEWRDAGTPPQSVYQAAAYVFLEPNVLKIKWGSHSWTLQGAEANMPQVLPSDPCDGDTTSGVGVFCYDDLPDGPP